MLSGIARTLDLCGTFDSYNESLNEATADARALYSDWRTIGETLAAAVEAEPCAPEASELVPELAEK